MTEKVKQKYQCGVYCIIHLPSKDTYIGHSINLNRRRSEHFSELRRGVHDNPILQKLWDQGGRNVFEFKILLFCNSSHMIKYEQMILDSKTYGQLNICQNAYVTNQWTKRGRHNMRVKRQGEKNYCTKLSTKDVLDIRLLAGNMTGRALAKKYNISPQHISDIINYKKWKHV